MPRIPLLTTTPTLVWRLEHWFSKTGPYQHYDPDERTNETILDALAIGEARSFPDRDFGAKWMELAPRSYFVKFGTENLTKLESWFGPGLPILLELGFVIGVYEVAARGARHGAKQSIFDALRADYIGPSTERSARERAIEIEKRRGVAK